MPERKGLMPSRRVKFKSAQSDLEELDEKGVPKLHDVPDFMKTKKKQAPTLDFSARPKEAAKAKIESARQVGRAMVGSEMGKPERHALSGLLKEDVIAAEKKKKKFR